ncbi:hypothetical protein [Actinoplanes sp. NPDC051859]|uniref:hypothetical protein n=1 Tax=Actinoplanes sp. NPDC051859 TaxID=3363909 RepID=UPI00379F5252
MAVADEPVRMFNVAAIHQADDEIHLCEGELDGIILDQIGLPAVGLPGVNSWRNHHRRMLAGFNRVHV